MSESGDSKSETIMRPTQGNKLFTTIPYAPIRAAIQIITQYFVLAYDKFVEVFADGTYIVRGNITTTTSGTASMAYNGDQIMIVDGTATGGYIYTVSSETFVKITDPNFQGGVTVNFITSYFMVNRPNSGTYQISDLSNGSGGLAWPSGQFANAESEPDHLLWIQILNQQAYLGGQSTQQVVYNSGGDITDPSVFTFSNVPGVFLQYGSVGSFASITINNTIFFMGRDRAGGVIIWSVQDYRPVRVSTQAIETYLATYDLTNVTTITYEFEGHYCVQFNIQGAPYSIVYDMLTQQWHYRARWNPATGTWTRDRANTHVYIFGRHLVTDYENGNIYEMSSAFGMDDTYLMRRIRRFPYLTDSLERVFISFAQLDAQLGVGTLTGNPEDINPLVSLSYSDDGGNTLSVSQQRSLGIAGNYGLRCFWNRLGGTRYRIFELDSTTSVPMNWIAFYVKISEGVS